MKFETTVYLGDVLIPKSELKNLIINSKTVDRIINDVAERQYENQAMPDTES